MSAAATAAGYLYVLRHLRSRGAKGEHEAKPQQKRDPPPAPQRREVRVAVCEPVGKPKRTPKIECRTRRWRPGGEPQWLSPASDDSAPAPSGSP